MYWKNWNMQRQGGLRFWLKLWDMVLLLMHIILLLRQRTAWEQPNAMTYAMKDAGIEPSQVDYINAHGTSTHHNDLFETRAIKLAFGEAQNDVLVSSTKSMVGHLLGAAGGIEFITCVKSIEDGYIHENVGLREVEDDEEFSLNYVKDEGISMDVNVCMTNSLGFGGHNATLIVKKYAE